MMFDINYGRLPPHLQGGVRRYIEEGIPPGDFLTAVITNNLRLAVGHADSTSLAALTDIVRFFHNESPSGCWGTPEKMKLWMETGYKKYLAFGAIKPYPVEIYKVK
jgi:hypothetical protein